MLASLCTRAAGASTSLTFSDMAHSEDFLRARRYDEALAEATAEIVRGESHALGSEWNVGLSLLLLGRHREAQRHFEKRAE